MKFIDMFCGIGTIRMGMEQAGHKCVYSIECDKWKRRIYGIIFGKEPEGQDIRKIHSNDLPKADCWCFGAPCQDFSIAGKRAGLEGDRSSLVKEVFRLVKETKEEYRPEWLFYENVKGMFSSNKGLDYFQILYEMDELGYDIEWQLLNSKDFGVPQNRERVFTIGHLRRYGGRKVFPIGGSNTKANELQRQSSITNTLTARYTATGAGTYVVESEQYAQVKQIGNCMAHGKRKNPNQGRVYDINGIAPTLSKMEDGGRQPFIQVRACLTPERINKRQNGRRFKEPNEPMFTLTKQDVHGILFTQKKIVKETGISNTLTARNPSRSRGNYTPITGITDGSRIRRLTPKECWRLQGIPDSITDKVIQAGISDTQMYKGAGDATTVNVIYEIAKKMS